MFVTNRGEGSVAFVSREDAARAAAAWLAGVPGSEGRVYDITGPTLVSPADEAALFSELSGQPVELIHVDDEAFAGRSAALSATPREIARAAAALGQAVRENYLSALKPGTGVHGSMYSYRDVYLDLLMSAAVPPDQLYLDGPMANEFARTVSRIVEMQSKEYLDTPRRIVDTSLT